MNEQWSPDDVAVVIRARTILKEKGLAKDADVTAICKAAGISRKSGYQWASQLEEQLKGPDGALEQDLAHLKAAHQELLQRYDDVRFENEGRKLAWKIHGVDEFLATKKNSTNPQQKQKP